ncbi:MAG: acyl carrier protein [Candidatus Binatia bacterium]|nr:acyl carrier protein [Candidatus Binatia bacterium]
MTRVGGCMLDADAILKFLEETVGIDTRELDVGTPLFSSGLIDSGAMVELITFVEAQTGVRFTPDDLTLENLDTIANILGFVARAENRCDD